MTKQQQSEEKEIEELSLKTVDAIFSRRKEKAKKLYGKAEKLFIKGNSYTRSLLAHKFIYPISHVLEMNYSWGKEDTFLFPPTLHTEYCRQINSSGNKIKLL